MPLNSYQKALEHLDEDRIIELTKKLIAIPSYHGLEVPEKEVSSYLYKYLLDEGFESEHISVAGERKNVIAWYGANSDKEKTLMLEGHMDTVDVKNMSVDPFSGNIENGNIYGRGSVDMKGALAAMVGALMAIKKAGIQLDGRAYFAGVVDEERNYRGADYIAKNGPITRYAIVGEPTELEIHNGHRGLIWIEVKVNGKYAHGGTPEKGINAIEKINSVITEIVTKLKPEIMKRKHPVTGPSHLNLGHIKGGTQPSTVAGECILQMDRRWLPDESQEGAVQEIENILANLKKKDPEFDATVTVMDDNMDIQFPPLVCEEQSPLVNILKEASSEVLNRSKTSYFPAWTDGSILSRDGGIETVVLGPGHLSSAHSEEEFCPVQEIIDASKIYIYSILKICS